MEPIQIAQPDSQDGQGPVRALSAQDEQLLSRALLAEQERDEWKSAAEDELQRRRNLADKLAAAQARLGEAVKVLEQIERMKTRPDHHVNTITLVAAHRLARAFLLTLKAADE